MSRNHPFGLPPILWMVAFCMLQLHGALGCGFLEIGHIHCVHQNVSASETSNGDDFCPCDHSKPNENHSKDVCNASAFTSVRTTAENFLFAFDGVFLVSFLIPTSPLHVKSAPVFVVENLEQPGVASVPLYLRDRSLLI